MAQQTAVEWLIEQYRLLMFDAEINDTHFSILDKKRDEIFEQAKSMEKQQIKFAYNDGAEDMVEDKYKPMEDYFNEKYDRAADTK